MRLTLALFLALIFAPVAKAQVIVSWQYIAGQEVTEDGFSLERAPSGCTDWSVIGIFPADQMSMEDIDVPGNCYRVQAFAQQQFFPYSNVAVVDEPPPPPPPQDTIPPTVSITNPANGAIVARKSTVPIQSTFSDNVGVVKVRYLVDGTMLNCPALATTCNWTVPNPPSKDYTIRVEASDQAGNIGAAQVNVRSSR